MKNKVVLITGATSGIGKALCYYFASKGSRVVIGARRHDKLIEIAEDLRLKGAEVAFVQMDVSVEADCKNFILTAVERFGKIDVLINNAGLSMRAIFEDTKLDVLKRLMDVNFWGTVYCTRYALPYLLSEKGSIVGVSSIAGFKGLPARSGYSASKFAMSGFLESVRIENLKKGLHVLIAFPGFTASNIRNSALAADGSQQAESPRDEQKMMQPEKVAAHIYCAVKRRKKTITLTLEGNMISLLNKYFPGRLDYLIYNVLAKEPDTPLK